MKGDMSSSQETPQKVLGLNLASSQRQKEDSVPSDMSFYFTPLLNFLCRRDVTFPIKGTHARDFHSLFLNFFSHLSVTNRYKTQYSVHFRKHS